MQFYYLLMGFFLHLKFTITGENADPFGVVVSNDNVTIGVDGDASGPLELPRRSATCPKTSLKLSIIRKYLCGPIEKFLVHFLNTKYISNNAKTCSDV